MDGEAPAEGSEDGGGCPPRGLCVDGGVDRQGALGYKGIDYPGVSRILLLRLLLLLLLSILLLVLLLLSLLLLIFHVPPC